MSQGSGTAWLSTGDAFWIARQNAISGSGAPKRMA
jgi:hypothetical protein